MRERRIKYENNPQLVREILQEGTKQACLTAQETMREVHDAMRINYFSK
jgi:tryptophanyl-tRNA synthetase